MVIPFCPKGSLIDLLIKAIALKRKLSTGTQRYLCKQMVLALEQLHKVVGLAHLDIKPDNFVFCDDLTLALIDFGHSGFLNKKLNEVTGTSNYFAPEIRSLYEGYYLEYMPGPADIFNLGMTFFMIAFMKSPFAKANYNDYFYNEVIRRRADKFFYKHKVNGFPIEVLDLIWRCI